MKTSASNTTDEYLEALPEDQRNALLKLRKQILAAAPDAEDSFGYGIPAFKYKGRALIYMGAAKHHCALYGLVPPAFADKLKGFTVSKGTIQFIPEKPIPATIVKAIVKAKAAEIDRKATKPARKTRTS